MTVTAAEELFEEVMRLIAEEPDNWRSILRTSGDETDWQHGKTFWKHTSGLMIESNNLYNIWKGRHAITSAEIQKCVYITRRQRRRLIPALIDLRAEKILRMVRRHNDGSEIL